MKIAITFKGFEPSDHLRKYAERRFSKLGRFMRKQADAELTAVLSVDKIRHKVDVHLTSAHTNISAMEHSSDMYASIDLVLDKLEAQLKKENEKRIDKRRRAGKDGAPSIIMDQYSMQGQNENRVLIHTNDHHNTIQQALTVEEAADKLTESEQDHLVFLHADTRQLHVLYRNQSGELCLIETTD